MREIPAGLIIDGFLSSTTIKANLVCFEMGQDTQTADAFSLQAACLRNLNAMENRCAALTQASGIGSMTGGLTTGKEKENEYKEALSNLSCSLIMDRTEFTWAQRGNKNLIVWTG